MLTLFHPSPHRIIAGFYRGIEANVMRAMVLNGTKMSCYDTIKGEIVKSGLVPKGWIA